MYFFHTLEIEATNYCNAHCIFCGNRSLQRERGYISIDTFETLMLEYKNRLDDNYYKVSNVLGYPKVNFCGLGDPLLHPQLPELVVRAKETGFYTQVVSNGICFDESLANKLCEAGLNEICISLHSVNPLNYKNITGVDLNSFLYSLLDALIICKENGIKINLWRIYHPSMEYRDNVEDERLYSELLADKGLSSCVVLGPSEPWYRDGVVPNSICQTVCDSPLWCNKILFTDYYDWRGNVILCCNDYNRECMVFGNISDRSFSYDDVVKNKKMICDSHIRPLICKSCKRWPDVEVLNILESANIDFDGFREMLFNYIKEK